jgi:hypothetical protein
LRLLGRLLAGADGGRARALDHVHRVLEARTRVAVVGALLHPERGALAGLDLVLGLTERVLGGRGGRLEQLGGVGEREAGEGCEVLEEVRALERDVRPHDLERLEKGRADLLRVLGVDGRAERALLIVCLREVPDRLLQEVVGCGDVKNNSIAKNKIGNGPLVFSPRAL